MYFVAVYSQAIFHPNLSSRLSRRMATLTDKEAMRETVRGQILKRLLSMEGNDNFKHRERNLRTCSFYFEDESLEEGFCTRYLDSGSLEPCLMLTFVMPQFRRVSVPRCGVHVPGRLRGVGQLGGQDGRGQAPVQVDNWRMSTQLVAAKVITLDPCVLM